MARPTASELALAAALAATTSLAAGELAVPPPALRPAVADAFAGDWDGGSPFFPTGRFVWVTHPRGFGFPADVHVFHHEGGEALAVKLRWNGKALEPASGRVFLSRVEMHADAPGLEVSEAKLLTHDDVLVSVLDLHALGAGSLEVSASSPWASQEVQAGERAGRESFHGQRLWAVLGGRAGGAPALSSARRLAAGERVRAVLVLALDGNRETARAAASRVLADADPAATEQLAVERWFSEAAPGMDCDDPWFTKAFLYRLAVVKKSILQAGAGYLRHPAAVEGRWATPWYPAAIPFGAGHQLAEMRWLADPALAWGHLANFLDNQRGDGAFVGARVDARLGEYTDFIAAGALDLYLATRDRDRFAAAAPGLARNVDYVLSRDCDGDFLPEPKDHWETGMEWQPSFYAFNDYDTSREERLERVEYAAYLHANALAAARALVVAGADPGRYLEVAQRTAAAVEGSMWDAASSFYLALRAADHRPALDREVVGFYPAALGITPAAKLGYLRALDDPERWKAPFPVPSVEMASPAFDSHQVWPIGRGGSASMWNGPTWPHAESFVARALARAEREGQVARGATFALLESYTRAHFYGLGNDRRLDRPVVGEMYSPFNGGWLTNERDYFHSTYVDLIVTLIAGVEPAEGDALVIDPLLPPGKWQRFALVRLPYHGRTLAIAWDAPGGEDAWGDGVDGLCVWVDGKLAARRPDLGRLEVTLR